jgi:hypothetical protein
MKENEKMDMYQMLLWLYKNKKHISKPDHKNVFIVHEYKIKTKLEEEDKNNKK